MKKIQKKILSPEAIKAGERVEKSRAENVSNLRQDRERNDILLKPDGDADVTNAGVQAGRRLHHTEIMRRINRLNPNLWWERSIHYEAYGGIYLDDPVHGKRKVANLPFGIVSEFTIPVTVPDLVPSASLDPVWDTIQRIDSKRPGWRATLLSLLMEGLVAPAGIDREFKITEGRSSENWQRAVLN